MENRRSEAQRRRFADPEVRARMSAASKKALADPEVRARISAARKKALADPTSMRRRENRGNLVCEACVQGNCLACDGDNCRCVCALEMDRPRVRKCEGPPPSGLRRDRRVA